MLTTSRLRVEVSKFVKQEIHSLINYMHSNLTHQQVTSTFSRHFAKVSSSRTLFSDDVSPVFSDSYRQGICRRVFCSSMLGLVLPDDLGLALQA